MAVFGWALVLSALLSLAPTPARAASDELVLTGIITVRSIHQTGHTDRLDFTLTDDQGVRTTLLIDEAILDAHGGAQALDRQRATIIGEPALAASGTPSAVRVREIRLDAEPSAGMGLFSAKSLPTVTRTTSIAAATVPATPKRFVTLLCRFGDMTGVTPAPASYFEGLVNGTQYPGMAHYFSVGSYGAISLDGSVVKGWYNLPWSRANYTSLGSYGLDLIADQCTALAEPSVDFRQFAGINLMLNGELGTSVGGSVVLTKDGTTRTWGATWIPPSGWRHHGNVAHEMGHALGLTHSSGPYGATYDSNWDVMSNTLGMCRTQHPAYGCVGTGTISYHKDSLGWIPSSRRYLASSGSTATIDLDFLAEPVSTTSLLMAKIPINGSPTHFYTVEARDLIGYDREIPGKAVIIHEVDRTRSDRQAHVVDPDRNGKPNDAGSMFLPGEAFVDSANDIAVYVVAETATGFTVTIGSGASLASAALTVTQTGTGRVTSTPAGLDCPTDCSESFAMFSTVKLHAVPGTGYVFTGWSGAACTGTSDCTLTVAAAQTVTARFVPASSVAPDLVVTALSELPESLMRSQRIPITATVVNQGDGPSSSSRVRFYVSTDGVLNAGDVLLSGTAYISTLDVGATASKTVTVAIPATIPGGYYTLLACADDMHVITERDETNNCLAAARPVRVLAPDLVVTELTDPTPSTVARGGKITFWETITNQGNGPAKSTRVRYYVSGDRVKGAGDKLLSTSRYVKTLVGGEITGEFSRKQMTVTVPTSTLPGTYYLISCADDSDAVPEINETNNCRSTAGTLVVTP
jgi:M6 family metalloprotease-like protein